MRQVEKEEHRVDNLLTKITLKEKEKDQRIEKLERIIKELKSKPETLEHEILKCNTLTHELGVEKVKYRKLEK